MFKKLKGWKRNIGILILFSQQFTPILFAHSHIPDLTQYRIDMTMVRVALFLLIWGLVDDLWKKHKNKKAVKTVVITKYSDRQTELKNMYDKIERDPKLKALADKAYIDYMAQKPRISLDEFIENRIKEFGE